MLQNDLRDGGAPVITLIVARDAEVRHAARLTIWRTKKKKKKRARRDKDLAPMFCVCLCRQLTRRADA